MPAQMSGLIKRQVTSGSDVYNVEISAAGIVIRLPRQKAYGPIPWGRIFMLGAQIEAAAERRPKRVSRGLLTV